MSEIDNPVTKAPSPTHSASVDFSNKLGWITPLAIKGACLNLITLGIYRFWFITDLRRAFWNRVSVKGHALEYTGNGLELFIGFLIAIGLLLPIYFLLFSGSFLPAPYGLFAPLLGALLFYLLVPFALYRMRKYRLGRTVWRGIRFHQAERGYKFAGLSIGWYGLVIITLGLATPWHLAWQERYLTTRSHYGNQAMASNAKARLILKPFFIAWIISVLPLFALILHFYNFSTHSDLLSHPVFLSPEEQRKLGSRDAQILSEFVFLFFPVFFAYIIVAPYFYARRFKAFTSVISLAGARLKSELKAWSLYKLYILYFIILLAVSVGIVALLFISGLIINASITANLSGNIFLWLMIIAIVYIPLVITMMVLPIRFFEGPFWRLICGSLMIENFDALNEIAQSTAQIDGGFNEGIGDALDVSGGFEIGL